MSFKLIILILTINLDFIHNQNNQYLDTDCYKTAGFSVDTCKKFTTFINGTEENFYIEPNVLYLCCYVSGEYQGSNYEGCLPIKEEVVFAEKKAFNFNCFSNFITTKNILILFCLINILF